MEKVNSYDFIDRLSYKQIDYSYEILEKYYNLTGSGGMSFFNDKN